MTRTGIIHDGVSIKIYGTDNPREVIVHFTDDITAFYKIKTATIKGKGVCCNGISSIVSERLQKAGVPTYFIKKLSDNEQLCRKAEVIPMEVIVRNVVAGSLTQKLGIPEGLVPDRPIVDLCYKNASLGDPLINGHHAVALNLVTRDELSTIYSLTEKINSVLYPFFKEAGITLVDFKIEFGRIDGSLAMCDDITPDSARLWDISTGDPLDKDRFRKDLSRVGESYRTVYDRLRKVCSAEY